MGLLSNLFNQKKVVCIIEDDPTIVQLLAEIFKKKGFAIKTAPNGLEGYNLVRKSRPVLVLLDIRMPVMDGFEALSKIKTDPDTKDVPVVMCTVANEIKDVESCCRAGAVGYITKPFDVGRIWETVNSFLNERLDS